MAISVPSGRQATARPCAFYDASDGQEIHRRRADEASDEAGARLLVDLHRRADLLDAALVHHHDARRHRHRFHLVVGDEDHGGLHALVQAGQLDARAAAQRRVEVGERFVEQERLRLLDDGTADGDALALTAAQLAWLAIEQRRDFQHRRCLGDLARDLLRRGADVAQAERHVLPHRHVRIEGVVLEHHRDAAVAWPHRVDARVSEMDLAGARRLEAGDHAQQGRFAAARRAQEDGELARRDFQRQVANDLHMAESLGDLPQAQVGHALPPRSTGAILATTAPPFCTRTTAHYQRGPASRSPNLRRPTSRTQANLRGLRRGTRIFSPSCGTKPRSRARESISHRMPGLRETRL